MRAFSCLALSLLSVAGPRVAGAAETLDAKVAAVLPSDDENRWLQIPWRTNLMEAIAESARTNKPVLLWVMNGNPLGCA